MITHYDLFAGIGGFSLALEEVFGGSIKHIFCEWEEFPTAVLKKHWPEGEFYGDIADLVADTERQRRSGSLRKAPRLDRLRRGGGRNEETDRVILTGGFPCQPFSAAGQRLGTSDDRYKWPEMFAVIRNVKPDWIIAENVRGLTTWNDGMVLEQVCTDLESEGYEVQPIVIPALAVNTTHKRERVWIIAHANSTESPGPKSGSDSKADRVSQEHRSEDSSSRELERADRNRDAHKPDANARRERRLEGSSEGIRSESQEPKRKNRQYPDWSRNWQEVALATCHDGVDDGLPRRVDGVPYTGAKYRSEALKAYGNAIVPQVAMQIFQAIKTTEGLC